MKTKLLVACLLFCGASNAQFSAGVKLNLSYGGINSANLVSNLNYQQSLDPKITEWSVKERWGYGFGLGGFAAYNINANFSCLAEPTIDFLSCGIDFTRVENKLDSKGDGDINTDITTSDISITYFSLPLLARYTFGENKFFAEAGLGFYVAGAPDIKSTASSEKDSYKKGVLDKTNLDPQYMQTTKLNVFDNPKVNFILGVGATMDAGGKPLSIDLRYNLPLTKSEMFTTDSGYNDGRFKKNDLLGYDGKTDAEKDAPYLLNDFKMSVVTLSVTYALFKK